MSDSRRTAFVRWCWHFIRATSSYWRNFVTWTKETVDDEVRNLLDPYGTKFQINSA